VVVWWLGGVKLKLKLNSAEAGVWAELGNIIFLLPYALIRVKFCDPRDFNETSYGRKSHSDYDHIMGKNRHNPNSVLLLCSSSSKNCGH
jgi:hypothetical protein